MDWPKLNCSLVHYMDSSVTLFFSVFFPLELKKNALSPLSPQTLQFGAKDKQKDVKTQRSEELLCVVEHPQKRSRIGSWSAAHQRIK